MKKLIGYLVFTLILAIPLFSQEDSEGCKDPALFTRMTGFWIYNCEDVQFDKFEFSVGDNKTQSVEGHRLYVNYYLKENVQKPSGLQIVRNYTNAIKKLGGQVVYEWEDGGAQWVTLKLVKGGQEVWTQVSGGGNGMYFINIIEKEAMEQDVVADANSMANSIKETGKVALYGIYFDSGQSLIKPESKAALEEISKLLKADPSLKIYVVGHTDNTGSYDSNMKLSMERASAVVSALASMYSVNIANLKPCGNGPTCPVASNDSEEGKALNRRVELVKQ